ncbi:MAG TPA: hypothetical protein VFG19_01985 [Geobacteraceae bacterium]|nr:hypothetical protein [Geobacteraceae bacterium]
MAIAASPHNLLWNEAQALLTRIDRMESFTLHTPMVPAAAIPLSAQVAIEHLLAEGGRKLRAMVTGYLRWLESPAGKASPPDRAQRRYSFLRLRFIAILSQLDIFADVLNQRSEHDTGVWLSGLDVFAADSLRLPGNYYDPPQVICFLARGPGAAIRRARTRLPGGDSNPVAVIQVPRERMIGSGIASSLVHECGHQGAALLDLIPSLQPVLMQRIATAEVDREAWECWRRWISEIIADLWAVARLGATATIGLMAVVGLPRVFVFRVNLDDPHPAPWIRVKLSCAMGGMLYPHPLWAGLARIWESYYPRASLDPDRQRLFTMLESCLPEFVRLLLEHRPAGLRGGALGQVLASPDLRPTVLGETYRSWRASPALLWRAPPTLAFAVIGQARLDGNISAEDESSLLADLLRYWALRITLYPYADSAPPALLRPTGKTGLSHSRALQTGRLL